MWEGVFVYDPTLPSCLRRISPIYFGKGHKTVKHMDCMVGQQVFRDGKPIAWYLKYKKKYQAVHRIIYEIFHGEIHEGLFIDHINGDPFDNRIENLRMVPPALNSRNRRKSKNNSSGCTGVHFETCRGYGYYIAGWEENGKHKKKAFSVFQFGDELAKQLAIEFRLNKITELNKIGFGYTETHGM